jgi:hypothetical protein
MATEKRLIDKEKLLEKLTWLAKAEDQFRQSVICGVMHTIAVTPTVDAVEVAEMREFAEDVVYQFGYYCQKGGRLCITHGGLSTLEWAFDILGWENPHPVPECECEIEGCHEHATCGTPTADGYKRMCGRHFRNHCAKMDGDL